MKNAINKRLAALSTEQTSYLSLYQRFVEKLKTLDDHRLLVETYNDHAELVLLLDFDVCNHSYRQRLLLLQLLCYNDRVAVRSGPTCTEYIVDTMSEFKNTVAELISPMLFKHGVGKL